jgi:ornithine carbamoyltransferase
VAPKRDFLALSDLSRDEIEHVLDLAVEFANAFARRGLPPLLSGKSVALWFPDDGFRNRCAFDLGIQLLGGIVVHVPGNLGKREPAGDVAAYLSNWFDALVVRAPAIESVRELSRAATVPVINGRTRHNHPCEVLGDLAFIRRVRGDLTGFKVVFIGEATNLGRSWVEAAARLPIRFVQVCPPGIEIAGDGVTVRHDLRDELRDADLIYTDTWSDRPGEQLDARLARLAPYRITAETLESAPASAMFLPCPPVHRGEEVSADAMTSPRCRVIEAKQYLLHAQNALLAYLLTGA